MSSLDLALNALKGALEKKALEPVLIDLSGEQSYTDYILVLSGRSDRQVQAVSEGVEAALREAGRRPIGVEGKRDGNWTLLDYGEVIVHVFYHPLRDFYDLEGLWVDAPRVALEVPPESRSHAEDAYAR